VTLGSMYKLAVKRASLRRVVETKAASLPQYPTKPLSSLTAVSDFRANRKFKPEPNPLTLDEQRLLDKLVGGMSRSRARVVGARRKARGDVRSMLAGSKLWG